jgi:hypothetical protein
MAKATAAKASMSCLDAAAHVLRQKRGKGMSCGDMIEAMAAQKLWRSPGGKTPASTLYSSILREIDTKGGGSRFAKTEKGKFGYKTDRVEAAPKTAPKSAAKDTKASNAKPGGKSGPTTKKASKSSPTKAGKPRTAKKRSGAGRRREPRRIKAR